MTGTIFDDGRICTQCKTRKSWDCFYIDNQREDKRRPSCKDCDKARSKITNKERRRVLKRETIDAYGGKCACCGEAEIAFLCIDHIYNDGAIERRTLGTGVDRFYRWLRKNSYPTDRYQVLCANCNHAKHFSGICPHQE